MYSGPIVLESAESTPTMVSTSFFASCRSSSLGLLVLSFNILQELPVVLSHQLTIACVFAVLRRGRGVLYEELLIFTRSIDRRGRGLSGIPLPQCEEGAGKETAECGDGELWGSG